MKNLLSTVKLIFVGLLGLIQTSVFGQANQLVEEEGKGLLSVFPF